MKNLKLIKKRLCPAGYIDDGLYCISDNTVDIPDSVFDRAIIVHMPNGVKGINQPCTKICVDHTVMIVLGDIKSDKRR